MTGTSDPAVGDWVDFDYALLRIVPHVHVGDCEHVGVVLHARTSNYIGLLFTLDRERLQARWPALDLDLVNRELSALDDIARGEAAAGPIGRLPPSERFHWITAPRSAVVQPTEVHAGRTKDPIATLRKLFSELPAAGP